MEPKKKLLAKKAQTSELKRVSRQKFENRVVPKKKVITVKKDWEIIADKKANKVSVPKCALILTKKKTNRTIVGLWLLMF